MRKPTLLSLGLPLLLSLITAMNGTPALAGQLVATVTADGDALQQAIVTARPLGFDVAMPPPKQLLVDQIDKEFVQLTTLIWVGDSINFPNKDNIEHHVYSFSAAKQFELPLYRDMPEQPILFDKPGVVKLGCNIHDWMVGYIYVADTPFAAMTGADGQVMLTGLPAGEYEVRVWHARQSQPEQLTTQRVRVEANDLSVEWHLSLKPSFRPQRAPLGIGRDY